MSEEGVHKKGRKTRLGTKGNERGFWQAFIKAGMGRELMKSLWDAHSQLDKIKLVKFVITKS